MRLANQRPCSMRLANKRPYSMRLANQRLMSSCFRLPVIFLKDVSSKDFERLLWYMYKGEVGTGLLQ